MKRTVLILTVAASLIFGRATHAEPDISSLKPFTPEANFMSLPGYVRFHVFLETGRWMSREIECGTVRATGKPVGTMG